MEKLKLSDNIARMRHERRITQEELADFLGVTKASVSKWENAQSMPDLMLLLQLAAYFDVTIDELLGYEARLSREQIRRCYAELTRDFASLPFAQAAEKARSMARRYYSCYPFLLQLGILYWNHHMLAGTPEEQIQILEEAVSWCSHIVENCSDVGVCGDAVALKAGLLIQLGRAAEAMELLEPVSDPVRLTGQNGALLIQAYRMAGEPEKARSHVQVKAYIDLLNLVGDAVLLLSLYENDIERCEETIRRVRGVIGQYRLERLHPNAAAQFYYQAAVVYAGNGKKEEAVEALGQFGKCVDELLSPEKAILHGDAYFDLVDAWIEELPLGSMAPRDKSFARQSVEGALAHPAFECIREEKAFRRLARCYAAEKNSKGGEELCQN